MNKNQIKTIVFDVGGVLQLGKYSIKPLRGHRCLGVHNYIARKLGISIDQWFDSMDTIYAESIEGKTSKAKVISILAENNRVSKKKLEKILKNAYKKNFKFNKQLFKQALNLKKKGYQIAIFSDQWHLSKEVLINNKIMKNFNPVIISCESGMRKPNSKFYRLLLKKLKVPAKQVLFIDNQQWNIKPAKKLGIQTILFKNNKQVFKQLSKLGILQNGK